MVARRHRRQTSSYSVFIHWDRVIGNPTWPKRRGEEDTGTNGFHIHLPRETCFGHFWSSILGNHLGQCGSDSSLHQNEIDEVPLRMTTCWSETVPKWKIPNLSSPSRIWKSQNLWIANRMVWRFDLPALTVWSVCLMNSIQFQSSPGWFEIFSRLGSDTIFPGSCHPTMCRHLWPTTRRRTAPWFPALVSHREWSLVDELTWVSLEPISWFTGKAWCFFLWWMAWSDLPKMDRFHVIPWTKTQTCPPKKVA
jgi:hypothetical protein